MCPGSFLRQVRVRSQDLDPRRPPSAGLPFLSLPCRCRRKAGGGRAGPGLLGARRGLPDVQLGGGQGGPRRRAVPPVLAGPEVGVAVGAARPPGPVGLRSPRALRPRRAYREQECPRYEANNRGVHVRCRFDDVSRLQRHIQFWVNGTSRRSGIPCSDLCVELPEIGESRACLCTLVSELSGPDEITPWSQGWWLLRPISAPVPAWLLLCVSSSAMCTPVLGVGPPQSRTSSSQHPSARSRRGGRVTLLARLASVAPSGRLLTCLQGAWPSCPLGHPRLPGLTPWSHQWAHPPKQATCPLSSFEGRRPFVELEREAGSHGLHGCREEGGELGRRLSVGWNF